MNRYERYLQAKPPAALVPGTLVRAGDAPVGTRLFGKGGNGIITVTEEDVNEIFPLNAYRGSAVVVRDAHRNAYICDASSFYEVAP